MIRTIRLVLCLQAAVFAGAALVHTGVLMSGSEHRAAMTAEGVIALVLFLALAATAIVPASSRGLGLVAQGFALLGTAVGIFTIAIGIGPRTRLDIALHITMVLLLVGGLLTVARRRAPPSHA
jgi:hypothetical protein